MHSKRLETGRSNLKLPTGAHKKAHTSAEQHTRLRRQADILFFYANRCPNSRSNCSCVSWMSSEEMPQVSRASSVQNSCCWNWRPVGSIWSRRPPSYGSCGTFHPWTSLTFWPTFLFSCSFIIQSSPTLSMTSEPRSRIYSTFILNTS